MSAISLVKCSLVFTFISRGALFFQTATPIRTKTAARQEVELPSISTTMFSFIMQALILCQCIKMLLHFCCWLVTRLNRLKKKALSAYCWTGHFDPVMVQTRIGSKYLWHKLGSDLDQVRKEGIKHTYFTVSLCLKMNPSWPKLSTVKLLQVGHVLELTGGNTHPSTLVVFLKYFRAFFVWREVDLV